MVEGNHSKNTGRNNETRSKKQKQIYVPKLRENSQLNTVEDGPSSSIFEFLSQDVPLSSPVDWHTYCELLYAIPAVRYQ